MKHEKSKPADAELRLRAEHRLGAREPDAGAIQAAVDSCRLMHELQVHQIELEMQNEELVRAHDEVEAGLERYADLYDFSPVGYLTLDREGIIRQANLAAARFLGKGRSRLTGSRFELCVLEAAQPAFNALLAQAFAGKQRVSCELAIVNMRKELLHLQVDALAAENGQECRVAMLNFTDRKLAEEALRKAHDELERRVAERTAELAETIEELHEQIRERIAAEQALKREHRTLLRLLQARDRERQAISLGIHDNLAQPLTSATMHFQAAAGLKDENPAAAAEAESAGIAMLRESIGEARRLISGVRPPILEDEGVEAAIAHLACESTGPDSPQIDFHIDARFERLAPALESAIYRIAQEGIDNARKHSRSDRAKIELVQQGDRLRIEIRDWGVGFDPQALEEESFGLEEIRERARLLGGTVTIESAPGKGTRIVADLPLSPPKPEATT